ncbi:prenylated Rab acceptor protein 1 [Dermatophagoides farinae]|uniref:PRA1 family protein n=1 Tax=Dermatophagoides farinae TaxID=6954 RepID=A0A9D4P1N1_DERFA|nr:prenylated Rab acceptor protein 1-like [Dermatophagoides farinae]KAH7641952.1 prenylated rab acceptor-like protein [Dermatophagoides farinae]
MSGTTVNEPQFVSKGSPLGPVHNDGDPSSSSSTTASSTGFINNSNALGMEPLGELDGAINNLAMSAKYNLTQMSFKQLLSDRWSKLQSWGSFIDTSRMILPISIQQWSKRLVTNFKHFQSNYLFVFIILCIYCILTSPLLLLVLAAITAAGYILTLKNAERPLKIFGKKLNIGQQYLALGICSLPLLYLVGAGSVVFWVIGASLFVITLHASVYAIENGAQHSQQSTSSLVEPFAFEIQSV